MNLTLQLEKDLIGTQKYVSDFLNIYKKQIFLRLIFVDFMLFMFMSFLFQDLFFWILEILRPYSSIEKAVEFDNEKYKKNIDSFGNH